MFATPSTATAICAAEVTAHRAALCFALNPAGTDGPHWVELIPAANAQGKVQGRDGRWWRMSNPQAVVDAFDLSVAVDVNHASELQAPSGAEAPAQGWVEQLEVRQGAIWGRVDWNEQGLLAVNGKKYRFLSPVFKFDPATREIQSVTSVGLVNQPNFPLALNRASDQEIPPVDKIIRDALGLPEAATPEQAVTAINALMATATSLATPPLDKFVPRADYDVALNRATTAEGKLTEQAKVTAQAAIDAAIDGALKAGKITPATVDYHKASCAAEGGLERFKAFVAAAAVVADKSGLEDRDAPGADTKALNAATKTVAALMGNSAEDIAKYGADQENA